MSPAQLRFMDPPARVLADLTGQALARADQAPIIRDLSGLIEVAKARGHAAIAAAALQVLARRQGSPA